jgi:HEPN superfamily AbiU2-like protein
MSAYDPKRTFSMTDQRELTYTPTLSAQIPKSFAANAFNVFQLSMYHFEIVRLCALWDRAAERDIDKESIPTVVELIADEKIIEELGEEIRALHANQPIAILNLPTDDPKLFT